MKAHEITVAPGTFEALDLYRQRAMVFDSDAAYAVGDYIAFRDESRYEGFLGMRIMHIEEFTDAHIMASLTIGIGLDEKAELLDAVGRRT